VIKVDVGKKIKTLLFALIETPDPEDSKNRE
jgi:hypothetical protein